jgi:protein tyrosine phosphatase (PTP) superfamily phosphohydrolase (DUF442 family)
MPAIEGTAYDAALAVPLASTPAEEHAELHNVFQLGPNIVSGSEPHGEEAFEILQAKGVRTILSVDGKVPDAETAARYGMKYVHVPIQYKGITDDEIAKIAKTFREQPAPFYVHCFHGKHRGPAAAEIGRLVLDGIPRSEAIAEMRQWCGTAKSYEGLYQTIALRPIPTASETRAMSWDFPAASPLEGVASGMVEIARADDHLKALAKNGWRPDPAHPDVDPRNEATKLASLFERSLELEEIADYGDDFRGWMRDAAQQSVALRDTVMALHAGRGKAADADVAYQALAKTCTACHDVYRN